jgi:hypothetical protein
LISEAPFGAEAATLTRRAIDLALDGNATALRLCPHRLVSAKWRVPLRFTRPTCLSLTFIA